MTGGGDDFASPFQGSYDWTSGTGSSGAQTVTARNNAGMTSTASFTVTPDSAAPTGHSANLVGGPYYTTLSVPVSSTTAPTPARASTTPPGLLERQAATLSNGNCVAWGGSWTSVTLTGGADTNVAHERCYRYRYSISDNVGNQSGPSALSARPRSTPPTR